MFSVFLGRIKPQPVHTEEELAKTVFVPTGYLSNPNLITYGTKLYPRQTNECVGLDINIGITFPSSKGDF